MRVRQSTMVVNFLPCLPSLLLDSRRASGVATRQDGGILPGSFFFPNISLQLPPLDCLNLTPSLLTHDHWRRGLT